MERQTKEKLALFCLLSDRQKENLFYLMLLCQAMLPEFSLICRKIMNLILRIAFRYLLALRKASTVQILSMLSYFGVLLGSMAMMLVLSAFNGFEGLVKRVFHYQDPDLRILPAEGRSLPYTAGKLKLLREMDGIAQVFEVISDKASLQFGDGQMVAEVFAADPEYFRFCRLDTTLMGGKFRVKFGEPSQVMVSEGIRQALQISFQDEFTFLKLAYPRRSKILKPGSGKIFNQVAFKPSGSLGIDESRVFIPLQSGRRLMEKPEGCHFLDVFLQPGTDSDKAADAIRELMGESVLVKNEYQLHEDLFRVMEIEKLFVFLALGFIILISSFNLFVSSSMMVLNKTRDFSILSALGMENRNFGGIVRASGMMLVLSGLLPGIGLGALFCYLQTQFGFVPLGMSTTMVKAYPVEIQSGDAVAIGLWVVFSALLALYVPAKRAARIRFRL
jgi:lipoprotein-releasing system permease protein